MQSAGKERLIMPYEQLADLPDTVKENLPNHAQEIYRAAFNSAWVQTTRSFSIL